ncbi:MAG: 6-carboxytetrahydropterin synthase [Planctomycetota bacterium]|nr:6-carboxytetrahydropterin synthase [Planctomycetota bacterium]
MLELARTVRFCLDDPRHAGAPPPRHNAFSAWPPMRGLGRYYQLLVVCRGEADPLTGYFINITHIDEAVRQAVIPSLAAALADAASDAGGTPGTPMGQLMRRLARAFPEPIGSALWRLGLDLSPHLSLHIGTADMDHVLLRQQFEFSAAHRLHVPQYSDEENRRIFGKCNNPAGHGHNYRLEVVVRSKIDAKGHVVPVEAVDALVDQAAVQKLDHKHLNIDVPQFAKLNPSVENIAKVIHDMLCAPLKEKLGVELAEVSVWETAKTVCTYRGE